MTLQPQAICQKLARNHKQQRIACAHTAGSDAAAPPAMIVSVLPSAAALISSATVALMLSKLTRFLGIGHFASGRWPGGGSAARAPFP